MVTTVDISDVVFDWMENQFPTIDIEQQHIEIATDADNEALMKAIPASYPWVPIGTKEWVDLYDTVAIHVQDRLCEDSDPVKAAVDKLADAFHKSYLFSAYSRLHNHVRAGWLTYVASLNQYDPVMAIAQSTGFGKTRMLYEYARLCLRANRMKWTNERFHLLYVGARDASEAIVFPAPTTKLREHLFPQAQENETIEARVKNLVSKLLQIYDFVALPSRPNVDVLLSDLIAHDPNVQDLFCHPPTGSSGPPEKAENAPHVLVIAVDDARALQASPHQMDWLLYFRNALVRANDHVRSRYGTSSGLLGLIVHTDTSVLNDSPPVKDDSSRCKWLAPFVLTHTIDVFLTKGVNFTREEWRRCFRQRVLSAIVGRINAGAPRVTPTWKEFCELGRPLWKSHKWRRKELIDTVTQLLLGPNVDGVAWLACALCRLGIRPRLTTPLAATLVNDYMAVISTCKENKLPNRYRYDSHATAISGAAQTQLPDEKENRAFFVSFDSEPAMAQPSDANETSNEFVVSYDSDPMLTLGATKLWHAKADISSETNLSLRILPRLITALTQDVLVHTGDPSDVVARILLLLAIDACGVLESGKNRMRWDGAGEMYRVETLLRALEGTGDHGHRSVVHDKWRDWFVSFTHFVELSETPTKARLWGLLGRRAAVVLPRGPSGIDLILPVCRLDATPTGTQRATPTAKATLHPPGARVSIVLVHVKNRDQVMTPRTKDLDPALVFSDENYSDPSMPLNGVLRIVMCPGDTSDPHQHVYVEDPRSPGSFALCVIGLGPWSSEPRGPRSQDQVEVVSPVVARELVKALHSSSRGVDEETKDATSESSLASDEDVPLVQSFEDEGDLEAKGAV